MRSSGSYFLEKMRKWKSVFGLRRRVRIAYEPIPWSAQGDPKSKKKRDIFQNRFFSNKKMKMYEKRAPKGPQMGEFISGVSALGHSWGTFGAPVRFLTLKMSPKCPQELQITPKVNPKKPKSAKSYLKSVPESRNGPKVNSCGSFLFRKSKV